MTNHRLESVSFLTKTKKLKSVHKGVSRFGFFSRSTSDIYKEVHWGTVISNVKEFFKNIHSLPAALSFKLTNQVATFI